MICVLIDWLLFPMVESISGEDCNVCTMVGVSVALVIAISYPKHPQMDPLYDILIDNLMDPAHVNYAHYGIMKVPKRRESMKADREGGQPMEINVEKLDVNGYKSNQGYLKTKFMAPCVFYAFPPPAVDPSNGSVSSAGTKEGSSKAAQRKLLLIFICVPVSPGKSRLIFSFPRNFALWADKLLPRWVFHLSQSLVLDSDLYLLHAERR